ncbi:hypothetical protein F5B18DRAFT_600453 [Nemania serpens]|nr:hypothetical protein F5B18DRAFT_600453 [Nemania serpens]
MIGHVSITYEPHALTVQLPNQRISDEGGIQVNNQFAGDVVSSNSFSPPDIPVSSELCVLCLDLRKRIWQPSFDIMYTSQHLQSNLRKCGLCGIIWQVYQKHTASQATDVMLERVGSSIRINNRKHPMLCIYRSLGKPISLNSSSSSILL